MSFFEGSKITVDNLCFTESVSFYKVRDGAAFDKTEIDCIAQGARGARECLEVPVPEEALSDTEMKCFLYLYRLESKPSFVVNPPEDENWKEVKLGYL